jgi:putative sterol carrier protein
MAGETEAFFARLGETGREPMLGRTTGTVRVDLAEKGRTSHWFVSIKRGDLAVTREDGPADLVLRADQAAFDEIAAGRLNGMAASLRGLLQFDGSPTLLVLFQRLLPAPTAPPKAAADRTVGKRRS